VQLDGSRVSVRMREEWSARSLLDLVRRNLLPAVVEFSRDASRLIAFSNIFNHVLLFTRRRHSGNADALDAFKQTATAFQGQVQLLRNSFTCYK